MLHCTGGGGGGGEGSCGGDLAVGRCDWGPTRLETANSVRGGEWDGSEGISSPRAGRVGAGQIQRKGFSPPVWSEREPGGFELSMWNEQEPGGFELSMWNE